MSLELFIALRYLRAKRKGIFAAVTTIIGVAGVTVGVAALITTLSVMNGFQGDIEKKIIGAQAHITIYGLHNAQEVQDAEAAARAEPQVAATAPFVLGQAILTLRNATEGVVLKGLDPSREFKVNDLDKTLREGSWSDLATGGPGGAPMPGIVLGEELAHSLGAWLTEEVVLVSPKSVATPFGLLPKMQKFRVVGLLHTGYYEYDSTTAYCDLAAAKKFFGTDSATGLEVRIKDLPKAPAVARRLQAALGPDVAVRTYQQMNETLFAALKLEKGVMFIILTLIVLVASLNIASTLILRSVEKTRDIGLLKSMGASPKQIRRIFLYEGFLIGALGMVAGLLLGLLLCWIIKTFNIVELPADIYYISKVPVEIQAWDVAAVMAMGFLLSLLATVYPAARAAKVDPVEAIHYG